MATTTCPTDDEVAAYLGGELAPDTRREVLAHLDSCARCRRLVSALAGSEPPDSGDTATVPGLPGNASDAAGARVGRFELVRLLGQGGMGAVWAATDPELGREVALKLIRLHAAAFAGDDTLRLRREAQAMARLNHANVVKIYELGTSGDRAFCAMELVDGVTLREHLAARRPWREVLAIARAVGRGLVGVHAAGLVHRDVKPDNILIAFDGRTLVSDFGLARLSDVEVDAPRGASMRSDDLALTVPGAVLGTPLYMAPEQLAGQVADARSDQFAYCVTMFEALFGERPFAGDTLDELAAAIARGPSRPADLRGAPTGIWRALARGLAADPSARWPAMTALLAELDRAARAKRRRLALVAVCGIALLGGAVALTAAGPTTESHEAQIARAWNPLRAAQLAVAFAGTGEPLAGERAAGTIHAFDAYRDDWLEHRRTVRFDAELRPRQLACFDHLARTFERAVSVYLAPTKRDLQRASTLTEQLESPVSCGDLERLAEHSIPARSFAGILAEASLTQYQALFLAGHHAEALRLLRAVVTQAEASGDLGLVARAHYDLGAAQTMTGKAANAEATLKQAIQDAASARDHYLVAASGIRLLGITAIDLGHMSDAVAMEPGVRAEVAAAGNDLRQQVELEGVLGLMAVTQGHYTEARAHFSAGLDRRAQADGQNHVVYAASEARLANVLIALGELDEARAHLEHAASVVRTVGSKDHPAIIEIEQFRAVLELRAKNWPAAERHARAVIESAAMFGDTYALEMAMARLSLGSALREQQRFDDARVEIERARETLARELPAEHVRRIRADIALAQLEDALHHDDKALALANDAFERLRVQRDTEAIQAFVLGEIATFTSHGSPARALPYYDRALELYTREKERWVDDDVDELRELGEAALAANQPQAALVWFDRLPEAAARLADLRAKLEHAR